MDTQFVIAWLLITVSLALLVATPVAVFVHELGHGVAALWFCDGPVVVKVSPQPPLIRFRLGRVRFELHPVFPRGVAFSGVCHHKRPARRAGAAAVALAGPTASLVFAAAGVELARSTQDPTPP